jgi:hypothetical protein
MRRPILCFAVLALVVSLPAAGAVFTVKLNNGNTIETRYRPTVAGWDEGKILLVTSMGNRISLEREDVEVITSETETKGYGKVIDTTTILLGVTANDLPVPGQGEALDPQMQLLNYLQQRDSATPPPFNVQQFAEPNSGGGLPIGFASTVTPPLGGVVQ